MSKKIKKNENVREIEPEVLDEFSWDTSPKTNTPEKIESVDQPSSPPPAKDGVDTIKTKMRELRAKFEAQYGEDVDIEIMYMQGIKKVRPYIVRSLNMADVNDIDLELKERCEMLNEQIKAEQMDLSKSDAEKSMIQNQTFITDDDVIHIQQQLFIMKAVLYPENIVEIVETNKLRIGDFKELLVTIYALSGYFPPSYDEENEDISPKKFVEDTYNGRESYLDK